MEILKAVEKQYLRIQLFYRIANISFFPGTVGSHLRCYSVCIYSTSLRFALPTFPSSTI